MGCEQSLSSHLTLFVLEVIIERMMTIEHTSQTQCLSTQRIDISINISNGQGRKCNSEGGYLIQRGTSRNFVPTIPG